MPYHWSRIEPVGPRVAALRERIVANLNSATVEALSLKEISFAFPQEIGRRQYDLEKAVSRETVGMIEGLVGRDGDDISTCVACALADGQTFEGVKFTHDPHRFQLYASGVNIGTINEIEISRWGQPVRWEIMIQEKKIGEIKAPSIVRPDSLAFTMADGARIPLRLARSATFMDFLSLILHLASFSFVWRKRPRPNTDYVIRDGADIPDASLKQIVFITSVIFRIVYYPFDFSGAGD
jgi:hypothetical protein